jgi:hypothetical protein
MSPKTHVQYATETKHTFALRGLELSRSQIAYAGGIYRDDGELQIHTVRWAS